MNDLEFENFLQALESGNMRAASFIEGQWKVHTEVKEKILEGFRRGKLTSAFPQTIYQEGFVDKDSFPPRTFTVRDGIRMVPGGSSVRRGSYLGKNVVLMPPCYVNVGAFVDEGSMIDGHALVGSCAQIGKRVHLSAAVQIGGVLEPIGQSPVIIEDDAFIGAGCMIVEGVRIGHHAVLAAGVVLSKGVAVYDCVRERMLEREEAIPPYAVVVAGSRPASANLPYAQKMNLNIQCALIIKYRDEKSNASLELESLLRS